MKETNNEEKTTAFLKTHRFHKQVDSYDLFKTINSSEFPKDTFIISDVVMTELLTVLAEQHRGELLAEGGVPTRFWFIDKFKLTKDDRPEIDKYLNELVRILAKEKITLLLEEPIKLDV